jgi:hypothetical protein
VYYRAKAGVDHKVDARVTQFGDELSPVRPLRPNPAVKVLT